MDCYGILEVERDAKPHEIKKAYYKLANKYHPDKGGDEESFKEIAAAYEILSDPIKREMFDRDGTILNDSESMINEWVKNTFVQMITVWVKAKIDGNTNDSFPQYVLRKIEENMENAEDGIEDITEKRKALKKYDKFASVDDGENVFEIALKNIRSDLNTLMREYNTLLYRTKALEKEFERYKFADMPDEQAMQFIQFFGDFPTPEGEVKRRNKFRNPFTFTSNDRG